MTHNDYWIESVAKALKTAGVSATDEQITRIAGDMRVASEWKLNKVLENIQSYQESDGT